MPIFGKLPIVLRELFLPVFGGISVAISAVVSGIVVPGTHHA